MIPNDDNEKHVYGRRSWPILGSILGDNEGKTAGESNTGPLEYEAGAIFNQPVCEGGEQVKIWKEKVMTYIIVAARHYSEVTEKNHKEPKSQYLISDRNSN
jgi:hypothetical protein